jgi:hypothetical protein
MGLLKLKLVPEAGIANRNPGTKKIVNRPMHTDIARNTPDHLTL